MKKSACIFSQGNEYVGEIVTKQIGITDESFLTQMPGVMAFEMEDLRFLPKRASHSNKGSFGKLLLIAGSVDMAGAAVLSAKAAYTAGCGLVRVFTPEENRHSIADKYSRGSSDYLSP